VFAVACTTLLISLFLLELDAGTISRINETDNQSSFDEKLPVIGFYPFTTVNPNAVAYPSMGKIKYRKKIHNVTDKDFEEENQKLNDFASKVLATKEPIFAMEKDSTAIITSCKLDKVCVTNIIYTLEFVHSDLPLGLRLLLDIAFSFSRIRLLSYNPMHRIVALEKSR